MRAPPWLWPVLHVLKPRIDEILADQKLTVGMVLGSGSFGTVWQLHAANGNVSPVVMKVTLDHHEILATALIMREAAKSKKVVPAWQTGLPVFGAMFLSEEKFRYEGPMAGRDYTVDKTRAGVIFREDLVPLGGHAGMLGSYGRSDADNQLHRYARHGIGLLNAIARKDPVQLRLSAGWVTDSLEITRRELPEIRDISNSLLRLLEIPLVLQDLHTGNFGYRAAAAPIQWSNGLYHRPLVVLDVGFSATTKRMPKKGIAILSRTVRTGLGAPPPIPAEVARNALDGIPLI